MERTPVELMYPRPNWPYWFLPQQYKSAPPPPTAARRPHVYSAEALEATEDHWPAGKGDLEGEGLCDTEALADREVEEERDWLLDEAGLGEDDRDTLGVSEGVGEGLRLPGPIVLTVPPLPSCPLTPLPQQEMAPPVVRAHVCVGPADTAATPVSVGPAPDVPNWP